MARPEGDPDRLALVLPGREYTPARPLLHYAGAVLRARGWTVRELWWETPQGISDYLGWVAGQLRQALEREQASRVLLVGKSLGSCALPLAAERALPGVWLTPLLTVPEVAAALPRQTAPTLLVGGTADQLWDGEAARGSGHQVLEIPGADHWLELPGDPLGSIGVLKEVIAAVDAFAAER